jgi:hypothetical protein
MSKKFLGRGEILEARDIKTEEVHVPEWGGWVRVRGLNGTELEKYERSITEGSGEDAHIVHGLVRVNLVAASVVGEDGKPLFGPADLQALARKSGAALDRVFDVARKLSGIGKKELEEMAKNSESGQDVISSSS